MHSQPGRKPKVPWEKPGERLTRINFWQGYCDPFLKETQPPLHSWIWGLSTGSNLGNDWGTVTVFWDRLDFCSLDLESFCLYRSNKNLVSFYVFHSVNPSVSRSRAVPVTVWLCGPLQQSRPPWLWWLGAATWPLPPRVPWLLLHLGSSLQWRKSPQWGLACI